MTGAGRSTLKVSRFAQLHTATRRIEVHHRQRRRVVPDAPSHDRRSETLARPRGTNAGDGCQDGWLSGGHLDERPGDPLRQFGRSSAQGTSPRARDKMKYAAIGFVLVLVPGVLVALVWGFAHGVIP
jgi:hypothetical protein